LLRSNTKGYSGKTH